MNKIYEEYYKALYRQMVNDTLNGKRKQSHRKLTKEEAEDLARKHKVGRNSKCPCGSGLKFKRCCGRDI